MNTSAITSLGAGAGPVGELPHAARAASAQFNAAAMRNASPADQRVAVAAQFEAILVRQMLTKTVGSMMGGEESGVAGSVYGDMLTESLAQQLSTGPGLGLSRYIEQQLTPSKAKLAAAADAPPTADSTARIPAPFAAPSSS